MLYKGNYTRNGGNKKYQISDANLYPDIEMVKRARQYICARF